MFATPRNLFRALAIAEAISWTLLITALVVRAASGFALGVTIAGAIHGFVFLSYGATAVLLASLPPALNVFVIARQYDTWIEPASVAVLIGTFVSVVTLTSVMYLLKTGQIAF